MKLAAAAVIAATSTVLVAVSPPAQASEAGYLARVGVDYDFPVLDEGELLRAGYELCDKLRSGIPREHLADALYWNMPNLTRVQADGIPYAAQRELCPETAE